MKPKPTFRSFYSGTVCQFLAADPSAILGQLSSRHAAFHRAAEAEQVRACEREISLLQTALLEQGDAVQDWSLLLEVPLLRLGKRLDAVVLAAGGVGVLEFKIGALVYQAKDRMQVERYAECLRDFHEAASSKCYSRLSKSASWAVGRSAAECGYFRREKPHFVLKYAVDRTRL